jgi:hypothetical protein
MGICRDKSTAYLAELGYNIVREPNAGLKPLSLLGRQNKAVSQLGPLNLLITNPAGPLPAITADVPAAAINGQTSSKLSIGIGLSVLGNLLGSMGGGDLGAKVNFTDASQIEFAYSDVLNDSILPLEVGNYLRAAKVDSGNLLLKQYVLGNGDLFLVTTIAKSDKFTVKFEKSNGLDAEVNVPVLQGIAGGGINVNTNGAGESTVTFQGSQFLTFAFQCFQVGVLDGVLSLMSVQPGGMFAATKNPTLKPVSLNSSGLLSMQPSAP